MRMKASTLFCIFCLLVAVIFAVLYFTRSGIATQTAVQGQAVFPNAQSGDVVQWTSFDGYGFTVAWQDGLTPCKETAVKATAIIPAKCTVSSTGGTYEYTIVSDEPSVSTGSQRGSDSEPGAPHTLVVGTCKACKAITVPPYLGQVNTSKAHTVQIYYREGPQISPQNVTVAPGDNVLWQPRGPDNGWTVTFTNATPCSNGQNFFEDKNPNTCYVSKAATPAEYPYAFTVNSGGNTYHGSGSVTVSASPSP